MTALTTASLTWTLCDRQPANHPTNQPDVLSLTLFHLTFRLCSCNSSDGEEVEDAYCRQSSEAKR